MNSASKINGFEGSCPESTPKKKLAIVNDIDLFINNCHLKKRNGAEEMEESLSPRHFTLLRASLINLFS